MSFLLPNLFHAKYCLLHTFTQHSPLAAQSLAFRFVEPFQSQVSYLRKMLPISLVFSMLWKKWNINKETVSLLPHFPSNVEYNFYILRIDDLHAIVIYSTCFTHFHWNFFWFWTIFCSDFAFQLLSCLLECINLKKKLWNKCDRSCQYLFQGTYRAFCQ